MKNKYRGKDIKTKEWVYGYYVKCSISGNSYIVEDIFESPLVNRLDEVTAILVDPKTVGQYIGLEDKNGKEMFDNDFIKDSTGTSLIVWSSKYASFCLERDGWISSHFFGEAVNPEDAEVIGSRTDNPELLNS